MMRPADDPLRLPKGRLSECRGYSGSGKSLFALRCARTVQRAGGVAAFADVDQRFDRSLAEKMGVCTGQLIVFQPESMHELISIGGELALSGRVDLLVIESFAGLLGYEDFILHDLRHLSKVIEGSVLRCLVIREIPEKLGRIYGNLGIIPAGRILTRLAALSLDAESIRRCS